LVGILENLVGPPPFCSFFDLPCREQDTLSGQPPTKRPRVSSGLPGWYLDCRVGAESLGSVFSRHVQGQSWPQRSSCDNSSTHTSTSGPADDQSGRHPSEPASFLHCRAGVAASLGRVFFSTRAGPAAASSRLAQKRATYPIDSSLPGTFLNQVRSRPKRNRLDKCRGWRLLCLL
jgi:hypothetical protein